MHTMVIFYQGFLIKNCQSESGRRQSELTGRNPTVVPFKEVIKKEKREELFITLWTLKYIFKKSSNNNLLWEKEM